MIIILLLQCTIKVVRYYTIINHLKNNRYMIEVNNISFKYAGGKNLVFDDFSLELKQDNIYGCCAQRKVA